MTTTTAAPPVVRGDAPAWYRPLLGWRAATLALVIVGLAGVLVQRGIVLDGPVRWTLALALAGATVGAALALWWTYRRVHAGRLAGFLVDFLLAIVAGFVALNRIGVFTGLDAAGEAFNAQISWLGIVVIGWLAQAYGPEVVKRVARWVMAAGLAITVLAMGLLPALVEFVERALRAEVLPVLVAALVAGGFARLLWSDGASRFFRSNQRQVETMDGLLFVAPNVLGFLAFFAGPLVLSLLFAFTEWDGLTDAKFVGLQNFIDLLSDDLFLRSLRNIVVFAVVAIPLAVMPALLLAALLNSKLPGMKFFRAVYFLPSIAGVVGVSLIWKQLFNSTIGYLNFVILKVTEWFDALVGSSVEAPQPQWISDPSIALIAVIILFVWQQIGFNTVLFLAGMQGIDKTMYEAADIDGAGPWQKFRKITVPTLRPTTVFVVATTTILALQLFSEPFILQAPSPPAGPGNSTLTPVVYLYQNAFQQFEIGYASAVAWALFVLIFAVTLFYFRRGGDEGVLGR